MLADNIRSGVHDEVLIVKTRVLPNDRYGRGWGKGKSSSLEF